MRIFHRKKTDKNQNNSQLSPTHNLKLIEPSESIFIKQITLRSAQDFLLLKHELIKGNIMVVNIERLVKIANGPTKDNRPLRQQLQYMKKYCLQYGGTMAKLKSGLLLVSPNPKIEL